MKRRVIYNSQVTAAEGDATQKQSETLDEMIDAVEDDFAYVIAGIEKLGREGATGTQNGMVILESLKTSLDQVISQIAEEV